MSARPGDVMGTFCTANVFPLDLWRNGEATWQTLVIRIR